MDGMIVPEQEHVGWMQRCLDLASRGSGRVSPNPMVGSVLVRDGAVLAEGWHEVFGGPHAERKLFQGLGDVGDLSDCILYVSLEPCSHFGKTPPCANLILEKGVGTVVVGVLDPNPLVSGRGVALLKEAGVKVIVGVLEDACRRLNWSFWVNQRLGRTAVLAKWAETADGFLGSGTDRRVMISGPESNEWVHVLRAGMDAILVGVNTWDLDQPRLNVRGQGVVDQPIRIVLDRTGRGGYTIEQIENSDGPLWVIGGDMNLEALLGWLYQEHGLGVLMVEGGAQVLESFLREGLVDAMSVLRNASLTLGDGVKSPSIGGYALQKTASLGGDELWQWERDLR